MAATSLKRFSSVASRLCDFAPLRENRRLRLGRAGKHAGQPWPARNQPRANSRRGSATLESIVVLVVLIIATLGAFQFGLALVVKQAVSHAATVAAREGAKGADADELALIVERVLEGHRIEIGDDATLVLEQGLTVQTRGQLPCTPPEEPLVDGDEVRVTVCVSLAAPPFLNLLRTYGIDLEGRTFTISSVATIE